MSDSRWLYWLTLGNEGSNWYRKKRLCRVDLAVVQRQPIDETPASLMGGVGRSLMGSEKECRHPSFQKERYLGAQTGDYVCNECGTVFSPSEKERIEEKRSTGEADGE